MCPNRCILLLIVYIIFSAFKACLNTYLNSYTKQAILGHKNKNKKIKSGCIDSLLHTDLKNIYIYSK